MCIPISAVKKYYLIMFCTTEAILYIYIKKYFYNVSTIICYHLKKVIQTQIMEHGSLSIVPSVLG